MNNNQPLVSIVVPAYNHDRYIESCIRSILNQTYKRIELIVLNDGSKDKTSSVMKNLVSECEQRCEKFEFIDKENEGLCKTLNRGIKKSTGDYITIIASDDMMAKTKIEEQINYLIENNEKFVLTNAYILYDETQEKEYFYKKIPFWVNYSKAKMFNSLVMRGNFLLPTGMYSREIFENIGLFDENLYFEDWDFYIRLSSNYEINYIDKPLFYYRQHKSNMTNRNLKGLIPIYESTFKILDKVFKDYHFNNIFIIKNKAYSNLYLRNAYTFLNVDNSMYNKCLVNSFKYYPINLRIYKHLSKRLIGNILK